MSTNKENRFNITMRIIWMLFTISIIIVGNHLLINAIATNQYWLASVLIFTNSILIILSAYVIFIVCNRNKTKENEIKKEPTVLGNRSISQSVSVFTIIPLKTIREMLHDIWSEYGNSSIYGGYLNSEQWKITNCYFAGATLCIDIKLITTNDRQKKFENVLTINSDGKEGTVGLFNPQPFDDDLIIHREALDDQSILYYNKIYERTKGHPVDQK